MPARFAKASLLAAGLLLAALLSPAGAQPPDLPRKAGANGRPAVSKLVQCTYPVVDLVIPIEDRPGTIHLGDGQASYIPDAPKPRPRTQEEKLIKLITSKVAPNSWSERGGPGTIDYIAHGMTLVINQTADVQQQVAALIADLRQRQDVQVTLEMRIVTVPERLCERVGVDFSQGKAEVLHSPGNLPGLFKHVNTPFASGSAKLTDRQAAAFLEAIQGDPQTNVLQAPRVTAFNGQRIALEITDRMIVFAGMDVERKPNGEVISRPKTEPLSTGLRLSLQPVLSADRRGVEMDVTLSGSELDSLSAAIQAPRPAGKCGQGKELPTAPERQARFTTHTLRRVDKLRDGDTLILDNGLKPCVCATETRVPVLGDIPYVNRLFRNVAYGRVMMHQLVLVTPRIIIVEEEEMRPPAVSACPFLREKQKKPRVTSAPMPAHLVTPLENLGRLEKAQEIYRQAQKMCRAGRREQATRAFEEVRRLCPGSRLDQLASRQLEALHGEHLARGVSEEQQAAPAVTSATNSTAAKEKKLAKLLRRYHEACAEGRLADARKIASRALAIDPACFSKTGN